jgi:hypothetical protein
MSALKKIGIILGSGGIIAIGYYFLNKRKPSIAEQQLSQLKADTTTLAEEQLSKPQTVEEKLIEDKCGGLPRGQAEKCAQDIKNATQGTLTNVPNSATNTSSSTTNTSTSTNSITTAPPRGTAPTGTRTQSGGRRQ